MRWQEFLREKKARDRKEKAIKEFVAVVIVSILCMIEI